MYSSAFCKLRTHICGHTTPPPGPGPWTGPPPSQLNIIRHFMVKDKIINFNLSLSSEVFEVRVPRLQMTRYADKPEFNTLTTENIQNDPDAEERRQLRREIKKWWEGIADHIDELVRHAPCFTQSHEVRFIGDRRNICKKMTKASFTRHCLVYHPPTMHTRIWLSTHRQPRNVVEAHLFLQPRPLNLHILIELWLLRSPHPPLIYQPNWK